ncbi:metallopeptidase family protein [Maritimibacter dapengensis]
MALDAVEALPDRFRKPAREVILRVEELAERDMLDDLRIDDPFQLTGLYDGVPLTQKSSMDQPFGPDVIWLFRRAILDEWVERGEVEIFALVSHVVVHEFAHHFGWSDDDIAVIDRWWE